MIIRIPFTNIKFDIRKSQPGVPSYDELTFTLQEIFRKQGFTLEMAEQAPDMEASESLKVLQEEKLHVLLEKWRTLNLDVLRHAQRKADGIQDMGNYLNAVIDVMMTVDTQEFVDEAMKPTLEA